MGHRSDPRDIEATLPPGCWTYPFLSNNSVLVLLNILGFGLICYFYTKIYKNGNSGRGFSISGYEKDFKTGTKRFLVIKNKCIIGFGS